MLKKYITNPPPTKFLLIKDNLKHRGKPFVEYLVRSHIRHRFAVHEFNFEFATDQIKHDDCVTQHDYSVDPMGWICGQEKRFEDDVPNVEKCVLIVDSLAHFIYYYGLMEVYRILNVLTSKNNVQQIVAVLHLDLLENSEAVKYFDHLSTLSITLQDDNLRQRVSYFYKKSDGKVVKEIEEYSFDDDGELTTKAIARADLTKLLIPEPAEIKPEILTTFKISLEDNEKQVKDDLVLPYLPKRGEKTDNDGKITYEFDKFDDWDEEDPDDDLDI